ncbi:MAG: oligoendopeptidase F [Phycisphaerae bacterium]|nr:MAG: oligoendopeptidase F [Phycisphaerae bacterium]
MIGDFRLHSSTATAPGKKEVRTRDQIESKYKWATEDIFATQNEWQAEHDALEGAIPDLAKLKGTLSGGARQLLAALQIRDETEARIDRVMVYASLRADEDTSVGATQEIDQVATALAVRYSEAVSWIEPELTEIGLETIQKWMGENEELAVYRQAFDDLFRQKKHILSAREEELIAMAGQVRRTPYNAYNLLTNADLKFPDIKDENGNDVELNDAAYYLFMRSPDRRVRKDAYEGLVGGYHGVRNTGAALLNGIVQSHLFSVKARGYESCLSAALDGGNIPVSVYNTLVDTIDKHLPLLHRYLSIKKRALKLDGGVHDYDMFVSFVDDSDTKYTFEEGVALMREALEPLGSDYLNVMDKGINSRWVDVYPTPNKRSGAYSSGTYLTSPYILLNYQGNYDSVSTLAHEMGHSMHSNYSRGTQPYVYSNYDIFCAEVASTLNEILLQHYVLDRTDDPRVRLSLLCEFMETIRGTVFRQTMFSTFEKQIHEMAEANEALTADAISEQYGTIMHRYYGEDYAHDDLVASYWIRIPHFYYNFYVYKYATSYCAASNIAKRIRAKEDGAVDDYLAFLSAGCSQYPVDLLKMARVDMTTAEPIEDAMQIFEGLLDQTEELLGTIGA